MKEVIVLNNGNVATVINESMNEVYIVWQVIVRQALGLWEHEEFIKVKHSMSAGCEYHVRERFDV